MKSWNWKHWPYWLRGEENKLRKEDIILIVVMSGVLSFLTFFSNAAYFYDLEQGKTILRFTSFVFAAPYVIGLYPLIFLSRESHDPHGAALGAGIFATLLSPLIAFILWLCLFYLLAKASNKFSKRFTIKHGLSVVIFSVIAAPYAYYMLGTNAVEACLSGQLTRSEYVAIYPDVCFKRFSERALGHDVNTQVVLNFCSRLSDSKPVAQTGSLSQLSGLSHQDYCLYTLAPLPTKELCEVIGSKSREEKTQCIGYFLWIQRPRSDSDVVTTAVSFSSVETAGETTATERPLEISLIAGDNGKTNSWFSGEVFAPRGLNLVEFDVSLNAMKTEALLSVYVNAERVAEVDGRGFADGTHHFQFEFPAHRPGMSRLGFRLDTFAKGAASVKISNIRIGLKDYPGVFDVPHNLR